MILEGRATCERTWRVEQPAAVAAAGGDRDVYRQHRCGLEPGHPDDCLCRYCGRGRGSG